LRNPFWFRSKHCKEHRRLYYEKSFHIEIFIQMNFVLFPNFLSKQICFEDFHQWRTIYSIRIIVHSILYCFGQEVFNLMLFLSWRLWNLPYLLFLTLGQSPPTLSKLIPLLKCINLHLFGAHHLHHFLDLPADHQWSFLHLTFFLKLDLALIFILNHCLLKSTARYFALHLHFKYPLNNFNQFNFLMYSISDDYNPYHLHFLPLHSHLHHLQLF